MYNRISIVGGSGSGKSTLCDILSKELNLPAIHLDAINFKENWIEIDKTERDKIILSKASGDKWIIDGNYNKTLKERFDKADLIITNMFHGAMLSVVRNKSFISLQTERRKQKIEFASKKLLFDKRCINEQDDWCIEDILDNELDFESINEIIEQEQNNVKTYFMKAFQT